MMPIQNPENKIKSLQDSLAAAKERQRRYDTQSKIVMGGILKKWMSENEQVRNAFIQRIQRFPMKPREMDLLVYALGDVFPEPAPPSQAPMPAPNQHSVQN